MHIPPVRIIASRLLSGSTIWLLVLIAAVVTGSIIGTPWLLLFAVIGFGAHAGSWARSRGRLRIYFSELAYEDRRGHLSRKPSERDNLRGVFSEGIVI